MGENSNNGGCGQPKIDDTLSQELANDCSRECGGTKFVGVPQYTLEVKNPTDGTTFLPGS